MEKLKNNKFKTGFAIVSLIVGTFIPSIVFFFFAGYAVGDILFSEK